MQKYQIICFMTAVTRVHTKDTFETELQTVSRVFIENGNTNYLFNKLMQTEREIFL